MRLKRNNWNNRLFPHSIFMMKTCAVLLLLAGTAATLPAAAPTWDNSGNGLLSGDYYFREVLYIADSTGYPSRAIALYGNIRFDNGNYTLFGLGGLDSQFGTPNLSTITTYTLSATGYGTLSDPLVNGSPVSILVSNGILIGSDTEAGYNSLFVAAPVASLNTSSFTGSYTVSAFDGWFGAGATYQLNPDGAGHLRNFTISGYGADGSTLTQSAVNIPYKFSNNAAVITYPKNANASFYSDQVFVYYSPDTNFIFGGSEVGYDMFLGVKNAAPGASTPISGLYYEAGIEEYSGLDSFYGTLNAIPGGNIVGHERLIFSAGAAFGSTFWASYPSTPITGSYQDASGTIQYTIGQNGFRLTSGTQGYLATGIAIPFTPPAPAGDVYIDPTGIVNTASSAPYTAGISPGEFLTFYNGVNLAPSDAVSDTVPFPTSLNGVQVLINDAPVPIYAVSPTQVSVIVPYDVETFPIAKIQIVNSAGTSNVVTMNVNKTTPGVFTSDPVGGIGVAALLDFPSAGGSYIVTNDNPAHPGDTVALYLTGLGKPYPSVPAGAAGPDTGTELIEQIGVAVGGKNVGDLAYAGLAPELAGLYQINFKIPSDAPAGLNTLSVGGPDSNTSESYIPITAGGAALSGAPLAPRTRHNGHAQRPR
jgi:uncharacterized protein (TIGR03437 family)